MRLAPAATAAAMLIVLWHASFASAAPFYPSQLPTGGDGQVTSDRGRDPSGFRYADDFTLTTGATVRSVTWRGSYLNNTLPVNALKFELTFYATNGSNVPDSTVATGLNNTNVQFTAADVNAVGTTTLNSTNYTLYEFRANLATPLALDANTRYWFSVMGDTSTVTPDNNFRWHGAGSAVSHASQSNVAGNANFSVASFTQGPPLYYQLDNAVIPEPASLSLLGASAFGLLARRRRTASR